jgi:DNA-binding response OmpR family regulator
VSHRPRYIELVGDSGFILVRLSPLARVLWRFLEADPFRFFSVDEIADGIYGDSHDREACIRVMVWSLRKKTAAAGVQAIRSRHSRGYRLAWRSIGGRGC